MLRSLPAYLLTILISAVGVWYASAIPINCDMSFVADAARRMLEGERLYNDNLNANTPFIMYYMMPTILLSRAGIMDFPSAYFLYTGAILTACCVFSLWVVLRNPRYQSIIPKTVLAATLPLILFFFLDFHICFPFGQREHLFFALFLPYVLLSLNMLDGVAMPRRMRWVVGVCALLACTIKPHFIVFYALGELCLMWRLKSFRIVFRPESLVVCIGFIAAHTAILLLFPEYISQLKLMTLLYTGQRRTLLQFMDGFIRQYLAYTVCYIVICAMLWRLGPMLRQIGILRGTGYIGALIAAGFFHFILHRTLYQYQALPMLGFFYTLCAYILVHFRLTKLEPNFDQKYFFMSLVAGLVLLQQLIGYSDRLTLYKQYLIDRHNMASFKERFQGKTMMLLSTSAYPTFPAIDYAEIRNVSTMANLLFVPSFYVDQRERSLTQNVLQPTDYHSPDKMPPLERHFFDVTTKDMVTKKPDLLIVDMSETKHDLGHLQFDFLDYFKQDPAFRKAMQHYRRVDPPMRIGAKTNMYYIYQRDIND